MAEEGPYEIMPYKEIVELRKQFQELKSQSSDTSPKLLESINRLTDQINSMVSLFKTAAEEMRLEEKDEHFVAKKIEPLIDKLDEIMEQNKTIAEGMVAVADIIKESMEKEAKPKPFLKSEIEFGPDFEPLQTKAPMFSPMGQVKEPLIGPPPGPMLRHTPPRAMPSMPMPSQPPESIFNGPFPFEEQKKKKGLFDRLKK